MQRDLVTKLAFVQSLTPLVVNNDTEGTPGAEIDMRDADAAAFVAMIGLSADTLSGTVLLQGVLEHRDLTTDSWAFVTDANHVNLGQGTAAPTAGGVVFTVDDPAEDEQLYVIGYRGEKRFARLRIDTTGTHTNGTPIAVLGIKGMKRLEGSFAAT